MKQKISGAVIFPAFLAVLTGCALRLFVFDIFRVEGKSMEPALPAGSIILVNRAAYGLRSPWSNEYLLRWRLPREQEILVYKAPWDGSFKIKRCRSVSGMGVFVQGDNAPESIDSRLYGSIPVERIAGKVVLSIQR
ncbi:MAG: S26 family signal peptidase [Spirochaetales bacterium]|jgi:signal peptidase I|nr:S26 family signal peptidase [Spirochaetales bacterium]